VNPAVDVYTTTPNHLKTLQKTSEKRKKQQPAENQKNTKHQNINYVRARFLHLACQRSDLHPCPHQQGRI